MYEYVITCLKCGAQRSTHGLEEPVNLSDAEVVVQAGHSPDCALLQSGSGKVQRGTRDDEPTLSLYTIEEAQ